MISLYVSVLTFLGLPIITLIKVRYLSTKEANIPSYFDVKTDSSCFIFRNVLTGLSFSIQH
jgi:hypothetical protein